MLASQPPPTPETHPLIDNISRHLPTEAQLKKGLKEEIQSYLNDLKEGRGNESKIQTLSLRKKLIDSHGLSLQRIDNLEAIFLHYCSHIFKTGKHMTFERLQYEKSHLTMDRFFVFLKDFSLTVAKIDGVVKEVVDKNEIVLMFKRVSINAKDLNFEQFISCLEKIGLLYYDSMLNYNSRQTKMAQDRRKRKEAYIKSMKRRKAALEAAKGRTGKEEPVVPPEEADNENKKTQQGDNEEEVPFVSSPKKSQGEIAPKPQLPENGRLTEPLNDKNLKDPIQQPKPEQVKAQEEALQNSQVIHQSQQMMIEKEQQQHEHEGDHVMEAGNNRDHLLQLTPQEKIEFFYQLINVDNAASFKRKMRELNLPLFQTKHQRNISQTQRPSEVPKEPKAEESHKDPIQSDEHKRLQQLRSKIQQRKQRDRGSVPTLSKEEYQQRRRRREKEEGQATVIVKKDPRKKKIDISELQIDLSSLSNMAHENINFQRFNPHKLIPPTEEQDPYLQEYTSVKKTQRSQKRILSNFEANDGRSQVMLQKMKKRAQEIEVRERNAQSKYSSNSEALVSTDHLLRKNRLVEKLMKIYKQ